MIPMERVTFVRGDFTDPDLHTAILEALGRPADAVISDAAPKLTGHKSLDVARTLDLARSALTLARKALRPGGSFVAKTFQGDGYRTFLREVSEDFDAAKGYTPPATSLGSSETYVVGLKKIG